MNQDIFDVIGTNVSDLEIWVYKISRYLLPRFSITCLHVGAPLLEMTSMWRLVLSDTAGDVSSRSGSGYGLIDSDRDTVRTKGAGCLIKFSGNGLTTVGAMPVFG